MAIDGPFNPTPASTAGEIDFRPIGEEIRLINPETFISSVVPFYTEHLGGSSTRASHPYPVYLELQRIVEELGVDVQVLKPLRKIRGKIKVGDMELGLKSEEELFPDELIYVDPLILTRDQAVELVKRPDYVELLQHVFVMEFFDTFKVDRIVYTRNGAVRELRAQDSVIYTTVEGVEIRPFESGSIVDYIKQRKELLAERERRVQERNVARQTS